MGLIDNKNEEKLQHEYPNFMNLNIPNYNIMDSSILGAFPGTPTDPAPSTNGANVIVNNTQRFSTMTITEPETPTSSGVDHHQHAFFNYPTNIFQPPQSASTIYGASPYPGSVYSSEPSTPANGFPTPNFLSPYNAYAIPTPMDFNILWPFNVAVDMGEITSDQAYQQLAVTSQSISTRLAPIHSVDGASQPNFPFMTRYGNGNQRNGSSSRRGGGRRPREAEERNDLNEEDRDKRDKRRQRNKEAAARCRQRRIDLMNTLQTQLDSYKQQTTEMERAINMLNQQKMQAIQILQHHGCVIPKELLDQPHLNAHPPYSNSEIMHQKNHLQQLPPVLASPPQNPNKRRATQQQQQQHGRMPVVTTMSHGMNYNDDDLENSISPTPSSTYTSSSSSLITNNDPVISDAAMDVQVKRVKEEQGSPMNNTIENSTLDIPSRVRPNTLLCNNNTPTTMWPLNCLPSITTPSNGLISFDSNTNDYGGLMNQQTGITPLVPQPMPVITSSGIHPPSESVLRQL